MTNRRKFLATTALLAAVAIAPAACKKEEAGGSAGGGSGASANMLSALPKDSKIVMGIAWSKARTSGLYKKFGDQITKNLPPEAAKIKSECGIDLLNDIGTVVVGGDPKDDEDLIVGIKGKFTQKQVEDCVVKMGGTATDGVYTVDGDVTNTYWSAPDTLIMSPNHSSAQLKANASGNSVKDNAALMGLIGKIDTSSTIWAVGDIPAEAGSGMGAIGGKAPSSGYMSLAIGSGVSAKIGMLFDSSEDANATKGAISGILTMAKSQPGAEFLGSVKASTDGNAVVLSGKITGDQITDIMKKSGGLPF